MCSIFAALEAKVKLLETNIEQHNVRLNLVEGTLKTSGSSRQDVTLPLHHQPGNVVLNIDEIPENGAGQSMTDGMAVSFVDEQDCGFFGTQTPSDPFFLPPLTHSLGPSSNIALMRHILRAVDTKRTQQGNQTSLTPASEYSAYEGGLVSNLNAFPAASSESQKVGANLLPPDEVMQRLIRAYFDNTGLLFPYIHEQEFLDTYERFRASGFRGNVRRTWLGLLNMILAMATCTSCWEDSGSETTFEESDVYYRRAQELCHTQMFRGTTLETGESPLSTMPLVLGLTPFSTIPPTDESVSPGDAQVGSYMDYSRSRCQSCHVYRTPLKRYCVQIHSSPARDKETHLVRMHFAR